MGGERTPDDDAGASFTPLVDDTIYNLVSRDAENGRWLEIMKGIGAMRDFDARSRLSVVGLAKSGRYKGKTRSVVRLRSR